MAIRLTNLFLALTLGALVWAPLYWLTALEAIPVNPFGLWLGLGLVLLSEDAREFRVPRYMPLRALFKAVIIAPLWPLVRRAVLSDSH